MPHLPGWTGYDGGWPDDDQVSAWSREEPADANLMLRINHGVIGIDVDAYDAKKGGETLKVAESRWGPLPPTYRSSSRSDDIVSGIRVFRVPEGQLFVGKITFPEQGLGDIDTIQPHLRHITAWPSVHPNGGRYRWYGPDGALLPEGVVPSVEDLPDLPTRWVEELTRDAVREATFDGSTPNRSSAQRERINEELYKRLVALPDTGPPDRVVAARLDQAIEGLISGTGNRYDTTRDHVAALMRLHAAGRTGMPRALDQLYKAYVVEVTDTRSHVVAEAEFLRFTQGAALLVAASSPTGVSESTNGDNTPGDLPFTNGASFIFDIPDEIPAMWGTGQRVLWPEGESLMICGPTGLGKTTLAGMLLRAQLLGFGQLDDEVLGLPVRQVQGKILYLAMDRPAQIARSLHRQFRDCCRRDALVDRLVIWKGPPPRDIAADPTCLAQLAEQAGAAVVYLDSLKDAAIGLSDDAVGAGYNRARQALLSKGVQLAELHHVTKNSTGGIEAAFGSTWLTAGAGSVIMLSGQPGDPVVGLQHLKKPAEEVGPLKLEHDEISGELAVISSPDLVALAKERGQEGINAKEAAVALFDTSLPNRSQAERARRMLKRHVAQGELLNIPGTKGGSKGGTPERWRVP